MLKVKILKTDERLGIVAGEIYNAERYRHDIDKVTLISRIPDGHDPMCNQYMDSVAHMIRGKWHVIEDNSFLPEIAPRSRNEQ